MHARALIAALIVSATCPCCRQADKPVPRRNAYYRIEPYSHEYAPVGADSLPARLMARRDADVAVSRADKGAWWVTISYPRYRAAIYVTILPASPDELPRLMAERLERLALDMGSSQPHIQQWSRGRYSGITATAPWVLATPVKLLAHDGKHLVSATAVCEGYADADEMAPVAELLSIDMQQLLDNYGD